MPIFPFAEARRIARGHGFRTKHEFIEYDCAGAYQLPKNADVVWADDWKGWDDFLGFMLTFEVGREVARGLEGVKTQEDYLELIGDKNKFIDDDNIASRLPYRPDLYYKDEWKGWDDWLGN